MRALLLFVSGLLLTFCSLKVQAQQRLFPVEEGERKKYNALIEMPKGYLSGICVLLKEDGVVKGCVFNEFGISALDFTYSPEKDKVKLHSVISMMNKWYIKKVLKRDLRQLFHEMQEGNTTYQDAKYKINYQFTPLKEDAQE